MANIGQMFYRHKKFFLFLVGIFFIAGCAYPPLREEKEVSRQIIEKINARRIGIQSFKGRVQITVNLKGNSPVLTEDIYYQKPNLLRLDTPGFLGLPFAILSYQKEEIFFYLPFSHRCYQGKISLEEFLAPALGNLGWKGENFLEGFFSQVLLIPVQEIVSFKKVIFNGEENYILETISFSPEVKQKIWVRPPHYLVLRNEIYDGEEKLVAVWESSDWVETGGIWFARKVSLDWKKENLKLTFSYQTYQINPIFSPDFFGNQSTPEETFFWEKIPNLLEFLGGQW